jgi:hypothetical protein
MIFKVTIAILAVTAATVFIMWLRAVYANERSTVRGRLWPLEISVSAALTAISALTTNIPKERKLVAVVLIFFAMIGAFQGARVFLDRERHT